MNTQEIRAQDGLWVEISNITIPEDVRKHTQEDIDSRAASFARDGQLENILLSKEGETLVLVYGNGRLESAKKLGWEKIRADVKEGLTESQKLLMTLAENEERENASPFYTASLYQRLMEARGLTQDQLADEIGKARQLVGTYKLLMGVSTAVRDSANALALSLRQCLALAKLPKVEDQLQVMEECAKDGLAGKALEKRIKQLLNPKSAKAEKPEQASQPPAAFQFTWKGNGILVKGRLFKPHAEAFCAYTNEMSDAYDKFVEDEKKHQTAA